MVGVWSFEFCSTLWIGVVGLKDLRKAIEDANSGSTPAPASVSVSEAEMKWEFSRMEQMTQQWTYPTCKPQKNITCVLFTMKFATLHLALVEPLKFFSKHLNFLKSRFHLWVRMRKRGQIVIILKFLIVTAISETLSKATLMRIMSKKNCYLNLRDDSLLMIWN